MLAQTNQEFEWQIYFDSDTPSHYLERAQRGIAGRRNIRLKLCDIYASELIREDLNRELPASVGWLLTTRFDNDDALHRDFVERLHKAIRPGVSELLNFPLGVVLGAGKAYLSHQESNAFLSLSEPFPNPLTVVLAPHNTMSRHAPVRNLEGGPGWMQVIHDSNVSNKLRGRRVPIDRLLRGFEHLDFATERWPKESSLGIAAENITFGVARNIRDRMASVLRSIRSGLGGAK